MKFIAIPIIIVFSGCATNTGNPSVDRRGRVTNAVAENVFTAVLSFGLGAGRAYLTGQNGQDAAAGVFDAAAGLLSSESIARITRAYAGPEVAAVAQAQFDKAAPVTPQEKIYTANVIGSALQAAANQLAE